MAGIITISPGHDASYPWRQIGTTAQPGQPSKTATDYYLSPAEKGGEPPGRWNGIGLTALGFQKGQVIDRQVFEQLYGHFLDPRDSSGQARLGRAPQKFRSADEIYATLAALEPDATAERQAELLTEARTQVRTPVQYFDATFSVSKSITLLHASALANAAKAADSGDAQAARHWQQAADTIWAAIQAGNATALDYLQSEAGYTRSGYHGRQLSGVSTGRWEDAHGFIIGSFAQHTSRDGDPQLHIHNLILNRVQRERDGAWRTLDSKALYEHRGAAAAIAAHVTESALSRDLGVGWIPRSDGHGREVAGISQQLMTRFSSRRQSITALTTRLAAEFKAQHGYAPDARALGRLRQWANHATRAAKDGEPLDLAAEARRWAAQARASEAGALEPVLPAVSAWAGAAEPEPTAASRLSEAQAQELMAQALARVQQAQPTWTKPDLIRHLGELLPEHVACPDDAAAARLLPALADRVLAGEAGEEILSLEAPEWPRVPESLRRADGRSVYRPHGSARYATLAQLTLEERLAAQAEQPGAPRVEPALAAHLLGADPAQLEAQLHPEAHRSGADQVSSGLRLDQAAAVYLALTSDRRAEIIVGPAGSGKTHTAGAVARLWRDAGLGEVHGLTTSQAARNVLHAAGVRLADNTAVFRLRLSADGPDQVPPGTLLLLDEASMMSIADLSAIMSLAAERNCRVLITGDHEQLAAVEGGGGMLMLTRRLGYAQLAEPIRFREEWERDATLRLRDGDISVLTAYDQHGRLRGGTAEEATELACRAWLADHLDGRDALLLARTEEQARELSRRVRDELIRYGLVTAGTQFPLRHGAAASPGDLIMARRNDHRIQAGAPGRWLTNRDTLRVEAARGRNVLVRRLVRRDDRTGRPVWSVPFELPRAYLASDCDLAYATTLHAAQGRTVGVGHLLIDGLGDRQGLYVGMSRGRDANYAYCVTGPRLTDTAPGSRPAAELARARRLAREQAGLDPAAPKPRNPGKDETSRHPVAVLAEVISRDGATLSATDTLRAELSNADHLGVLGAIWYDLTRRVQVTRFEHALRAVLPEAEAQAALSDIACTWLWRTLREAEAAGLDAEKVLRQAADSRPLRGARHVARVIDARIRRTIRHLPPQPREDWAGQVPRTGDPDLDRFLAELAQVMDDRVTRIGAHAAQTRPRWAISALGDVPADEGHRAEWAARAALLGAYREMYGYDAPADAIGPEPARVSPEARADWRTAFAALARPVGTDLRGRSDAELRLMLAAYHQQVSWAPPYVAEDLRLARLQARTAHENHLREQRETRAATDPATAARHGQIAASWLAMHATATQITSALIETQETRSQWESLTEPARRAAIAADQELRRRHADRATCQPQSAEPAMNEQASVPTVAGARVPRPSWDGIEERVQRIREDARAAQDMIDRLPPRHVPGDDADELVHNSACPALGRTSRTSVIQPPRLEIPPTAEIIRRAQAQRAGLETEIEHG